jgi:hypothetical protein
MYVLTTLHALRARLGLAAAETADDLRLLNAMQAAAYGIERATGRRFSPRLASIRHTVTHPTALLLDDDLLELTALTNGDGSSLNLNNLIKVPDTTPYGGLMLTGGQLYTWNETRVHAITVTGIWGYHDRWSDAWLDSGDTVQNNPLSSGGTTITVTDADGADSDLETPRFQVGHLLRIESEYLRITAVNTATNILTVQRGVNGTTPAAHAQNTPIYTYQPPTDVAALALRWASWLYREPDTSTFAPAPANLMEALAPLRRATVKA